MLKAAGSDWTALFYAHLYIGLSTKRSGSREQARPREVFLGELDRGLEVGEAQTDATSAHITRRLRQSLAALRASSFVAIAEVAMHRREHVVVIRPGRRGIVLHTMFYESELRREDEHRLDLSQVAQKELDLAVMLINSLANPFDSSKYRDSCREKLEALIASKLSGKLAAEEREARPAPVINILMLSSVGLLAVRTPRNLRNNEAPRLAVI